MNPIKQVVEYFGYLASASLLDVYVINTSFISISLLSQSSILEVEF